MSQNKCTAHTPYSFCLHQDLERRNYLFFLTPYLVALKYNSISGTYFYRMSLHVIHYLFH